MSCVRKVLAAFAGVLVCAGAALGQKPATPDAGARPITPPKTEEDPLRCLFFAQAYEQVAISPDGRKVAWVETQIEKNGERTGKRDIYLAAWRTAGQAPGCSRVGRRPMWGVTQTDRFRAAVAGAGIANWSSYYGENQIGQWMIPFFGKSVYDDPAIYARSAPLTFIKNVKTPTLILVGDSDNETGGGLSPSGDR